MYTLGFIFAIASGHLLGCFFEYCINKKPDSGLKALLLSVGLFILAFSVFNY